MTEIVVTNLWKQGKDGGYPVVGYRVNDVLKRPVAVILSQADIGALLLMMTEKNTEQTVLEVDDNAWSYILPQVAT